MTLTSTHIDYLNVIELKQGDVIAFDEFITNINTVENQLASARKQILPEFKDEKLAVMIFQMLFTSFCSIIQAPNQTTMCIGI